MTRSNTAPALRLHARIFRTSALVFGVLALAMNGVDESQAGEQLAISASEGLPVAKSAALAWAGDAELVYVENDEPLDASGDALRWGYLFRSPSQGRSRGYSVQGAKVVQAADLALRFDSPPLGSWVDSARALASAEEKQGAKFRTESGGELAHMVLIRSAADPKKPERTSWLVVYRAPGLPSLFVLVDAASGNVDRTWRG
ncbi:MAG: hypothetical protein R3E97_16160 [Candidatus Eisenbacteria bacterium]